MNPLFALMLVPLVIWAGVFAFVFVLDRRVRALERRVTRQESGARVSDRPDRVGVVTEKEPLAR